jgi:hypothetical protein
MMRFLAHEKTPFSNRTNSCDLYYCVDNNIYHFRRLRFHLLLEVFPTIIFQPRGRGSIHTNLCYFDNMFYIGVSVFLGKKGMIFFCNHL